MPKKIIYLVLLGGKFDNKLPTVQDLVISLSEYKSVICFEYPQFKNFINVILGKEKFFYNFSRDLLIYHSIGFLPLGRTVPFFNQINHIINYLVLYILKRLYNFNLKIITITPEVYYLFVFRKIISSNLYYFIEEKYISLPYWDNYLQKRQFMNLEKKLIPFCKKIIANSRPIYNVYSELHKQVVIFSQPSNISEYLNLKNYLNKRPFDLSSIRKPIAGFIGSFYDWKVDIRLFYEIVKKYSKISFVVIGLTNITKKWEEKFNVLNNYYFLGHRDRRKLPYYVSHFDICLIPYSLKKAYYAFPTKIYEYLALGKPVVTTSLPAIEYLRGKHLIYLSKNKKEFFKNINKALKERPSKKLIKQRKHLARINSWEHRINDFISIIA